MLEKRSRRSGRVAALGLSSPPPLLSSSYVLSLSHSKLHKNIALV